jgi:hypothetical protein
MPEGSVDALEFIFQEWGQYEDEIVLGGPEVQELYDFLGEWLEGYTSRLP